MKILTAVLLVGVLGTLAVAVLESIFGVVNVFIGATICVFIVGVVVVPLMQIKSKSKYVKGKRS